MLELQTLIDKFWTGTISNDELKRLENLLKERASSKTQWLFDGENDGKVTRAGFEPEKENAILRQIHEKMRSTDEGRIVPLRKQWFRWASIAASILIGIGGVWLWASRGEGGKNKEGNGRENNIVLKKVEYKNNSDTMTNILLPDGSMTKVYSQSGITYYLPFRNGKRDVILDGIAEFKVKKDSTMAFTVYAGGVATTALGTRFKVETHKGGEASIFLYEGKVVVRPAEDSLGSKKVYLNAGQELDLADGFVYRLSPIADTSQLLSAKDNKVRPPAGKPQPEPALAAELKFRNTPLLNVFDRLGRKFNMRFSYADKESLRSLPFTGRFNDNDSLDSILKILCGMNNLQYQIKGNAVKISNQ